ncbi:putative bifunctional diguanylate cyclase/phosphodiesterase [Cellulomonas fengjieae]|uniref:Bifunctional diguanylate cyclase/phosphodiesterase n=1 Tax=Cellulomonas fengjieae TaxID=2819978 RepID=A0ABS3SLM1_9CELL|nr:bifunctional diguanylate cyclase/phosphodiesterase [Cellulomonas fengjieae]MBO3086620.1 bifunctional diguanylate cyclase/phosphodiesterase [Cellulomonas fengjieae]MBO3100613.1 bifunctional diguanylate cyclase/phosphodiesterase [Cellulomonas fengjieae]QVI66531.1 bifunctional diguanylate cyclase/phosphodiesterase [Cellulomonas fengjieae]
MSAAHDSTAAAVAHPDDPRARETSGVTTALLLNHVRARGGDDAVRRVVERAGLPFSAAELEDTALWIGYHARIRLFEAAVEVLDDERVAFETGAQALTGGMNASLVLILKALGSPTQVYRQLPRSVPKFSSTSTMQVLDVGPRRALLRYTLHDGYPHSRLDCAYARGLISVVPEVFGLPRAVVLHPECQSDGHPACVYQVTWGQRRRWWRAPSERAAGSEAELLALRRQLEDLQSAAAELVGAEDLADLADRITERAAAAVLAPAYLLVLTDPAGGGPRVHSHGLEARRRDRLVGALLRGEDLGPGAVVVEVASRGTVHGHIAALYDDAHPGPAHERSLLRAYATHAAAALDLLRALAASRRGEQRSANLLELAHHLRSATDPATVARAAAAVLPEIVGADSATFFTYDAHEGALQAVGFAGQDPGEVEVLTQGNITTQNSRELSILLARQVPTLITPDNATPVIGELLGVLGLSTVLAAPVVADGEVLGVATAGWRVGHAPSDAGEATERLQAVAEYAATALENVYLLGRLQEQSLHDALTRLPNRVRFRQEIDTALQAAGGAADGPVGGSDTGSDGARLAVLFCDLDRFKHVNDVLGHAAGDEVLRQAADRLRATARPQDLIARLSGDEFALLLRGPDVDAAAQDVASDIVAAFAAPFRVEGLDLRVTASVGVALHDGTESDPDVLLRSADSAMYSAKLRGRNQVAQSRGRRAQDGSRRGLDRELSADLRNAAREGQLRLHVQPIVVLGDLADAVALAVDGPTDSSAVPVLAGEYEALLRWEHPRLGLLAPGAFLPLAEETGSIVELDLWVVRAACALLGAHPSLVGLSLNTSAHTLCDPRWVGAVREALAEEQVEPSRLWIEVVESRSLADLPGVAQRLQALRRMGVRIALDDFGTGFSTLSWLQRLPVDRLKLDRSVTVDITSDAKALAVAQGVLDLAERLGVDVVAEGVETSAQRSALRAAGFRLAQGYLWGRPAPLAGTDEGAHRPSVPEPPRPEDGWVW